MIDFLGFPPCTIAAAAVLTAAGERVDSPAVCTHFLAANRVVSINSISVGWKRDFIIL